MAKVVLTPLIENEICSYIAAGAFPHVAAEAAGVRIFENSAVTGLHIDDPAIVTQGRNEILITAAPTDAITRSVSSGSMPGVSRGLKSVRRSADDLPCPHPWWFPRRCAGPPPARHDTAPEPPPRGPARLHTVPVPRVEGTRSTGAVVLPLVLAVDA